MGGLQNISDALEKSVYTNEYDLQLDIYNIINSAHDEHFNYYPDIVYVLNFEREHSLLSISKDGLSLPEVYVDSDLSQLVYHNVSNYTASPVTHINGQLVATYLDDPASNGQLEDVDANYNTLFPVIPTQATGFGGLPLFVNTPGVFWGSITTVTFKNGSVLDIKGVARTELDWRGVTDANTLFDKFCTGKWPLAKSPSPSPSPSASASASLTPTALSTEVSYSAVPSQTASPALPNFPGAEIIASDMSIACYFPTDNRDLAVLSVPTFGPLNNDEFQDVARQCFATSKKLGKTKLVVDLRGNGGGTVLLAFDVFKQLFPTIQPWGATNFRAFPLFDEVGKVVTNYYGGETLTKSEKNEIDFSSIFNVQSELNAKDGDFANWEAMYGPVHVHGDTFTNLVRYNLSDPYDTGMPVDGYRNMTNSIPSQTFAAQNVVMLHDGACGSTCAVFAEFMKMQGNVQSIVMGGRPQYGPMQAVAGVKGANVYAADYVYNLITQAFKDAPKSIQTRLQQTYGKQVEAIPVAYKRTIPNGDEGPIMRVNFRNNIRKGDTTLTPLQFVYEAANCRLFYTAPMNVNQELVWEAAYIAQWGNGTCVQGSTGQDSAKPGTSYILSPLPGNDKSDLPSATTSGGVGPTATNVPPSATGQPSSNGANGVACGGVAVALVTLFSVLMVV